MDNSNIVSENRSLKRDLNKIETPSKKQKLDFLSLIIICEALEGIPAVAYRAILKNPKIEFIFNKLEDMREEDVGRQVNLFSFFINMSEEIKQYIKFMGDGIMTGDKIESANDFKKHDIDIIKSRLCEEFDLVWKDAIGDLFNYDEIDEFIKLDFLHLLSPEEKRSLRTEKNSIVFLYLDC